MSYISILEFLTWLHVYQFFSLKINPEL